MLVGSADVGVIRRIRHAAEADRRGSRPDVGRELSIAITALEDAEMRMARALVRASRHQADAETAIEKVPEEILADEPVEETGEDGEATDSERKEVG